MRRGRRYEPEYEMVVPREEYLVRNEQPLPLPEVSPPPLVPVLTPTLPDLTLGPKVETPGRGGAPSGDIGEEQTVLEPVNPPVEPSSLLANTPPPLGRGQWARQPFPCM